MEELPIAAEKRARVCKYLDETNTRSIDGGSNESPAKPIELTLGDDDLDPSSPLFQHLAHGLALTVGSALGSTPPPIEVCLTAFQVPNKANLTTGARAWSKHAHRSQPPAALDDGEEVAKRHRSDGWWGTPSGPVATINERALALFWKVMRAATWRNLHWLPHQVLVYEVRVPEGYGMRWSQNQSQGEGNVDDKVNRSWIFRGFVEPMMENGHEIGWRHPP